MFLGWFTKNDIAPLTNPKIGRDNNADLGIYKQMVKR